MSFAPNEYSINLAALKLRSSQKSADLDELWRDDSMLFSSVVINCLTKLQKPVMDITDLMEVGPFLSCDFIKRYKNIPDRDTKTHLQFRNKIGIYLESVAVVQQIPAMTLKTNGLSLLGVKLKFSGTSGGDMISRASAVVIFPSIDVKRPMTMEHDIHETVKCDLVALSQQIRDAEMETFYYNSQQNQLIFSHGMITGIVQQLINLQNVMNESNSACNVKVPNFLLAPDNF